MNTPTHHDPHPDALDDAFARRLRSRLDAEVWDLPEASGPDAAVSRGRARRRNRRAVLASAAVFAVVAASSQAFTDDPDDAGLATASETAVVDRSVTFDWTVTDDGLSSAHQYSAGDSGLYALSTAPRIRTGDAPRAMYRLADDGTWTPIALEGDDPRVATLSERGGALYALSTGPANGAAGGPTGSVSSDGGETWSNVPLETPTPPSDAVAWEVYYSLDIASTADRTIALVAANVQIPYETVFPELFTDSDVAYSTVETDEGIDLVREDAGEIEQGELEEREREEQANAVGEAGSPAVADPDDVADPDGGPTATTPDGGGDVVRTVTWSELGISGPADLAPQRWAYAADGDEWNEISTPSTTDTELSQSARLDTVGDRFLLTLEQYSDDGSKVDTYVSADGQDWATIQSPGAGQVLAAGNSLLYVGYSGDGNADVVQVSHDLGSTWAPIDLRALDPSLENLADGHYVHGAVGPLGVALLVHQPDEDEEPEAPMMLFSTDLESWSITDLAEVVPDGGYAGEVLVGTDRIAILGHTGEGEPGSPERSATLVGVPRRT